MPSLKKTILLKNANHHLTTQGGFPQPSICKKTQYLRSTIKQSTAVCEANGIAFGLRTFLPLIFPYLICKLYIMWEPFLFLRLSMGVGRESCPWR